MVTTALFMIARAQKQPRCPLADEWIRYVHAMECYSAMKKNKEMLSAATRMDLEGIVQSDTRQADKDRYQTISFVREI